MDPPDKYFTRLLSSDSPNPRPENATFENMQNFAANQFPTFNQQSPYAPTFNQAQFPQNSAPTNFFQNFNPFGAAGTFQQHGQYPPYQGFPQQPHFMHSPGISRAAGGTSSNGSDSTPQSRRQEVEQAIQVEDSSESSADEGRRGPRVNYTEEENILLVGAWIKHSVDSIKGTDKTGESYWKSVAAEFNASQAPGGRRRTKTQLKSHWGKISAATAKFNGVYERACATYCSGQSEDMLMDKARTWFKGENKKRPFTLEYVWKILKNEPKWRRIATKGDQNKRTKVDESGAYTSSSNQDTDEGQVQKEKRPEGQKKAKAKLRKGKEKVTSPSPLGNQPDEDMVLFHDAMEKRAAALEKTAEAAKEKTRMIKLKTYLGYLEKDTSGYTEARLKRHEQVLDELNKELFPTKDV